MAVLVLLAISGGLLGCQQSQRAAAGPTTGQSASGEVRTVNSMCPIGRHEWQEGNFVRPVSLSRTHKGTTIGFCCQNCVDKWEEMTEAERDEVRGYALKNEPLPW